MARRVFALLFLLGTGCLFAQQRERPRCTQKLVGNFWPEEANHNPRLAIALSREGTLEICGRGEWRYRWRLVSINAKKYSERQAPAEPVSSLHPAFPTEPGGGASEGQD